MKLQRRLLFDVPVANCKGTGKPGPCAQGKSQQRGHHDGYELLHRKEVHGLLGMAGIRSKTHFLETDGATVHDKDGKLHERLLAGGWTHKGHAKEGSQYSKGDHDMTVRPSGGSGRNLVMVSRKKPTNNSNGATMTKRERTELINKLVTNGCGCWTEEDRELLRAFEPARLRSLVANAEANAKNEVVLNSLKSQLGLEEEDELTVEGVETFVSNLKNKKPQPTTNASCDEPDGDEMPMKKKKKAPVANSNNGGAIWNLVDAPQEVQDLVANAELVVNEAKVELVTRLTANAKPEDKAALTELYMSKGLPELKLHVKALPTPAKPTPTPTTNQQGQANHRSRLSLSFFGGQAANEPTVNSTHQDLDDDFDPTDILPIPTMNYGNN